MGNKQSIIRRKNSKSTSKVKDVNTGLPSVNTARLANGVSCYSLDADYCCYSVNADYFPILDEGSCDTSETQYMSEELVWHKRTIIQCEHVPIEIVCKETVFEGTFSDEIVDVNTVLTTESICKSKDTVADCDTVDLVYGEYNLDDHYDVIDDSMIQSPVRKQEASQSNIVSHEINECIGYEEMVQIFQPLIIRNLIVHEILPYLPFLQDHDEIYTTEKRSPKEAVICLLNELKTCKEVGKWHKFMDALSACGYEYIVKNIRGYRFINHEYQAEYLKSLAPKLSKSICTKELLPRLYAEDVISQSDREEIEKELSNRGNIAAATLLLNRIPRKHSKWYTKFIIALRDEGFDDIADDLDISELTKSNAVRNSFMLTRGLPSMPSQRTPRPPSPPLQMAIQVIKSCATNLDSSTREYEDNEVYREETQVYNSKYTDYNDYQTNDKEYNFSKSREVKIRIPLKRPLIPPKPRISLVPPPIPPRKPICSANKIEHIPIRDNDYDGYELYEDDRIEQDTLATCHKQNMHIADNSQDSDGYEQYNFTAHKNTVMPGQKQNMNIADNLHQDGIYTDGKNSHKMHNTHNCKFPKLIEDITSLRNEQSELHEELELLQAKRELRMNVNDFLRQKRELNRDIDVQEREAAAIKIALTLPQEPSSEEDEYLDSARALWFDRYTIPSTKRNTTIAFPSDIPFNEPVFTTDTVTVYHPDVFNTKLKSKMSSQDSAIDCAYYPMMDSI